MIEIGDVVYYEYAMELRQGVVRSIYNNEIYANVSTFVQGKEQLDMMRLDQLHHSKIPVLQDLIKEQIEIIDKETRIKLKLELQLKAELAELPRNL